LPPDYHQSTNPLTTHPSPKGQIRRSHRLKPERPGVRSAGGGGQIGPPTTRQAAISSERNAPTPPDRAGARPNAILCRKKFKKYQRKKKSSRKMGRGSGRSGRWDAHIGVAAAATGRGAGGPMRRLGKRVVVVVVVVGRGRHRNCGGGAARLVCIVSSRADDVSGSGPARRVRQPPRHACSRCRMGPPRQSMQ
jgi:hypothetical protein